MEILHDGSFEFAVNPVLGLRPSKRSARNKDFLTECYGAVGLDDVLQVLDNLQSSDIDTSALAGVAFPYPQLFVLSNVILVCTSTKIYEYASASLILKYTAAAGDPWEVVDFHSYLYLSNRVAAVVKNSMTGVYAASTLYLTRAMCNFNGQVIVAKV